MEDMKWFSSISLCGMSPNSISFALDLIANSAELFVNSSPKSGVV
jgi:hypothetical protein